MPPKTAPRTCPSSSQNPPASWRVFFVFFPLFLCARCRGSPARVFFFEWRLKKFCKIGKYLSWSGFRRAWSPEWSTGGLRGSEGLRMEDIPKAESRSCSGTLRALTPKVGGWRRRWVCRFLLLGGHHRLWAISQAKTEVEARYWLAELEPILGSGTTFQMGESRFFFILKSEAQEAYEVVADTLSGRRAVPWVDEQSDPWYAHV